MATKTTGTAVHVWRCNHCGLEYFSLQAKKPIEHCAQCDRTFLVKRILAPAGPEQIRLAKHEDACRARYSE